MTQKEIEARIRRIERILGLEGIPGLNAIAVKLKKDETGAGFIDAKQMLIDEIVPKLFKEEMHE